MPRWPQPKRFKHRVPALRQGELEAFGRACKQLDALAAMLHASGWNGKGVALVMLTQVYEPIARIYNRCEAHMLGLPDPASTEAPQGGSEEGGPGGSSSSAPAAVPGSLEA
jgi:hypothetical protein